MPKAAAKLFMQEGGRRIFDKISEVFVLAQPPSEVIIIIMLLLQFFGPEDDDNTHTHKFSFWKRLPGKFRNCSGCSKSSDKRGKLSDGTGEQMRSGREMRKWNHTGKFLMMNLILLKCFRVNI